MVDLGLSVKFAKYNIGAYDGSTKESWYGDFYAWGETETKSDYSWDTYAHSTQDYDPGEEGRLIKYIGSDGKKVLKSIDDVATKIYGSDYRMPTKAELEELLSLSNKWVTDYNGVSGLNGRLFTGRNGNTLFIPAIGCFTGPAQYYVGDGCYLWSSSLDLDEPDKAYGLSFNSSGIDINHNKRYLGFSIRCVSKK